jgi:hypothetical protein
MGFIFAFDYGLISFLVFCFHFSRNGKPFLVLAAKLRNISLQKRAAPRNGSAIMQKKNR